MDELSGYWNRNKDNKSAPEIFPVPGYMTQLFYLTNVQIVNHLENTSDLAAPGLKETFDFWKKIRPYENGRAGEKLAPLLITESIVNKDVMFAFDVLAGFRIHFEYMRAMSTIGDPVFIPWRDINGKINCSVGNAVLINASSQNKESAWGFIKTMLSDSVQQILCTDPNSSGVPVNNEVFEHGFVYFHPTETTEFLDPGVATNEPLPMSYLEDFIKLQEEIGDAHLRYPVDRDFIGKMLPYCEGEKPYEETLADAKEYIDIYLTE